MISLAEAKADALLVTALDEVAWALNLRGRDVPYNPIFVAYVVVTKDAASLYVDASKARMPAFSRSASASLHARPSPGMHSRHCPLI
jgi:hypothetical protein